MKMFRGSIFQDMLLSNNANVKKAKTAIRKFCDNGSSRQRDSLYDFLDNELDIRMNRISYDCKDKRRDHPRFECTNKQEVSSVVYRVVLELEAKKS